MNIAFLTRTKEFEGFVKGKQWLENFSASEYIKKILITTNVKGLKNKLACPEIDIIYCNDKEPEKIDPTGTVAINLALEKIIEDDSIDGFLIASREITMGFSEIIELIEALRGIGKKDEDILVAGYKFKVDNKELNMELEEAYNNKNIAFMIPWNTCALWNLNIIREIVRKTDEPFFDVLCDKNSCGDLKVKIDNKDESTKYKGMEDGLAIAKACTFDNKLRYRLLEKQLGWEVNDKKYLEHRKKIVRKDIVLSHFIGLKGYSVNALKKARLQ